MRTSKEGNLLTFCLGLDDFLDFEDRMLFLPAFFIPVNLPFKIWSHYFHLWLKKLAFFWFWKILLTILGFGKFFGGDNKINL